MHTLLHFKGSSLSLRETRLLGMTPPGLFDRAGDLVTGRNRENEEHQNRIKDEAESRSELGLLQAFDRTRVFTDPVRVTTAVTGTRIASDTIEALPPAERISEFYRFVRRVLPRRIWKPDPPATRNACFNLTGLDMNPGFDAETVPGAGLAAPSNDKKAKILRIVGLVLGKNETDGTDIQPDENEHARTAYIDRMPIAPPEIMFRKYRIEMEEMMTRLAAATPPTVPDETMRRDPAFLKNNLRPSEFLGWLRVMTHGSDPARIAQVTTILADLHGLYEQRVSRQRIEKLNQEQIRQKLDKTVAESIRRGNTNYVNNFNNLPGSTKMVIFAAALYLGYKMITSESRLPRWIAWGLLGTFAVLGLRGDRNALNTMISTGMNAGNGIGDAIRNRTGLQTPTAMQQQQMALMTRYFNRNNYYALEPDAAVYTTLARTPVDALASGLTYGNSPRGPLTASFNVDNNANLRNAMGNSMDEGGHNRTRTFDLIRRRNTTISHEFADTMVDLAGREPANRERHLRVQESREAASGRGDRGVSAGFGNMNSDTARADYMELLRQGIELAQSPRWSGRPFYEVVGSLLDTPEPQRDLADHISPAERHARRPNAARLTSSTEALSGTVNASNDLLKDEFREFTARMFASVPKILDEAGVKILNGAGDLIAAATDKTLTEKRAILQRLEYAVLLSALNGGQPIPAGELTDMIGDLSAPNPLTGLIGRIGNSINRNIATVSSAFMNVETVDNVLATLRGRLSSAVTGPAAGFPNLTRELNEVKANVVRLRIPANVVQNVLSDASFVSRFDNREQAETFVLQFANSNEYMDALAAFERSYAQDTTNDIVEAMIGTMRRSDVLRPDRMGTQQITAVEERNLAVLARDRAERMLGPSGVLLSGSWARQTVQTGHNQFNVPMLAPNTLASRDLGYEHARRMAPLVPMANNSMRNSIAVHANEILANFRAAWTAATPAEKDAMRTENWGRNIEPFLQNLRIMGADNTAIIAFRVLVTPAVGGVVIPPLPSASAMLVPPPGSPGVNIPPFTPANPIVTLPSRPGDPFVIVRVLPSGALALLPPGASVPPGSPAPLTQPLPGAAPALLTPVPGQVLCIIPHIQGASVQLIPSVATPGSYEILPVVAAPSTTVTHNFPVAPEGRLILARGANTTIPFEIVPPAGVTRLAFIMRSDGTLETRPTPPGIIPAAQIFAQPAVGGPALAFNPPAAETIFVVDLTVAGRNLKLVPGALAGQWVILG